MMIKIILIIILLYYNVSCSSLKFSETSLRLYVDDSSLFDEFRDFRFYLKKGINLESSCGAADICFRIIGMKLIEKSMTHPTNNSEQEFYVLRLDYEFYRRFSDENWSDIKHLYSQSATDVVASSTQSTSAASSVVAVEKEIVLAKRSAQEFGNYIVDQNFHNAADYERDKVLSKMQQNLAYQIHDLAYRDAGN